MSCVLADLRSDVLARLTECISLGLLPPERMLSLMLELSPELSEVAGIKIAFVLADLIRADEATGDGGTFVTVRARFTGAKWGGRFR